MVVQLPRDAQLQDIGQIAGHNTYGGNWLAHLDKAAAAELDVHPSHGWRVSHEHGTMGGPLHGYIKDLAEWRKKTDRARQPLTVFLEMKEGGGWKVPDFESELINHGLDRQEDMFRPADLVRWARGKSNSGSYLRKIIRDLGWPTVDEIGDKIMFVLNSASQHVLDTYLDERSIDGQSKPAATCFVMRAWSEQPSHENIVIFNEKYAGLPEESGMPSDRCLRRAWEVPNQGDKQLAKQMMNQKKINFLGWDDTSNAFAQELT
jgi:hypothetical protein